MTSVFISYSRRDKEFVERLHDALKAREYDVWVDWEDIPPSAEWFEEIRTGLSAADGFIYVISPHSVSSEVCTRELDRAVEQRKRILPILHREPDGNAKVPDAAATLNWVYLRDSDDFNAGVAQLVSAIETDLDHVRTHTRLGVAANRWEASGRERSQLLRGSDLSDGEAWLVAAANKQPPATELQRAYLLASRQAATRRQRAVIGATSVALAVAVALAIVALIQRSTAIHERNVAQARQYDVEAQQLTTSAPEVGLQVALQAVKVAPSDATTNALRQALEQSRERIRYQLNTAPPRAGDAVWSPDGTRLLVTSPGLGGWARIYPAGSATPSVALAGGAAPSSQDQSGWDGRGDRVIIGGADTAVYDGHSGALIRRLPVRSLDAALTTDGALAVTVDTQSIGRVFDVATGRQLAAFHPRFTGGLTCFALSPDDAVAAQCDTQNLSSLTAGSALDLWNIRTGKLIRSTPSALISSVAFGPGGTRYVFGTLAAKGPATFVYETATGRRLMSFTGAASAVAFSPSVATPEVAYATTGDDEGHIYQFFSGRTISLAGATDSIDKLAFSPDGGYIVSAGRDNTARVYYAIEGGQPLETLFGDGDRILQAGFGDGDRWVATSSDDGTTRLWTGPASIPSLSLPAQPARADLLAQGVAFSPDGKRLLEASSDGAGRVLDARNLQLLARFQAPAGQGFGGAAESRDGGALVAVSGPFDPRVKPYGALLGLSTVDVYNPASGALLRSATPVAPGPLFNAAIDYAGDKLATLGVNGAADVWDTRTGRLIRHLPGTGVAGAAAFSKDGSLLAIAHYPPLPAVVNFNTTFGNVVVDLFDVSSGRLERTLTGLQLAPQVPGTKEYAPLTAAFSPNGRMLAVSGAQPAVQVFDPRTGQQITKPLGVGGSSAGQYADSLLFSPNGRYLAVGLGTGAAVLRVPVRGGVFTALPVFEHVPAGDASSIVGAGVAGVTVGFTDNSSYLVTSGDLTVEAWDLASHLQLFHAFPAVKGAMSSESDQLAVVGGGGLGLYSCGVCGGESQLLALAKSQTTAPLTPSQRASYLNQS